MTAENTDGRKVRGDATRRTILGRAMDIASVEGLGGLSLGRLASDLELSKSGIFAHFGSKQELQLATIRAAAAVFVEHVVAPAQQHPPGLRRLWSLCDHWLDYSRRRVFPGGCFFRTTTAEFEARPGVLRDALAAAARDWSALLAATATAARDRGELGDDCDPEQLAFEINALLSNADAQAVLHRDADVQQRASTGILARLHAAVRAPDAAALPPLPGAGTAGTR